NIPQSHWSDTSSWEIAKCLSLVEKEDLKLCVQQAKYISLSLDEVTAVDNTSWICIHVYTFANDIRTPHLLEIHKMTENYNSENIYKLVVSNLKDITGMDDYAIATKLVCVGTDGAAIMQGYRN
ncbi:hypothetical protein KI387_043264, partial [Taxus chinensis]